MNKCFTLSFALIAGKLVGEFKPGFRITEIGPKKFGLHLGAKGEGSWYQNVEFYRRSLPTVTEKKVGGGSVILRTLFEANLVELEGKGKDGELKFNYVLAGKVEDEVDGGILLRINTKGVPTKGASGSWMRQSGLEPQPLPLGFARRPVDGGESAYWDGLIDLNPGNVLWVTPEGGDTIAIYYHERKGLCFITEAKANWLIKNTDTADIAVPTATE